jgi:hypothetical protein
VNQEKSKVAQTKFVKFLGMTILAGTIAISKVSMCRAMERVKELTLRGTEQTIEQSIVEINRWYMGWSGYYKMTEYPSQLGTIEAHIRRRLRARIVSQQKKRRHLFEKIVRRGVKKRHAANAIFGTYSNRGKWALSHSKVVERAFSNRWFTQIGLKTRSETKQAHWTDLRRWPRL